MTLIGGNIMFVMKVIAYLEISVENDKRYSV